MPPHTAPPAHLGKPFPIPIFFFTSHSLPQATPADVHGCYRAENFLCICGYHASYLTGLFRQADPYSWIWLSWHHPSPQILPVTAVHTPISISKHVHTTICLKLCLAHHRTHRNVRLLCGIWYQWTALGPLGTTTPRYPPFLPIFTPVVASIYNLFVCFCGLPTFYPFDSPRHRCHWPPRGPRRLSSGM